MKLLAYGLLLVFTMSGMKKCETPVDGKTVNLSETFELGLEESVMVKGEKIGITFLMNKESRCPENVNCMRAGEAKASFQLTDADGTKDIMLEAQGNCQEQDGSCGESKTAKGYKVKLISISPYPGTDAAKNKDAVKAKLQVMKN